MNLQSDPTDSESVSDMQIKGWNGMHFVWSNEEETNIHSVNINYYTNKYTYN